VSWRDVVGSLLGISTYQAPAQDAGPTLDDPRVERQRAAFGGQLSPLPQTKTRWYLADLDNTVANADAGDMGMVGRLYRAMRRDGVLSGVLSTRTGGVVCLPKKFYGDADIKAVLEARNGTRSTFDDLHPPAELALLAADGIVCGVGVGELLPVQGRDFPVLCRLDPEWLRYRWAENRWYYNTIAGPIPITPGDGRWVLHTPGGRVAPWQHGQWQALGRAWINKEHAMLARSNWEHKLANPARAAIAPLGASEGQRRGMISSLIAWGFNTVFELPPGWDVKLIESKGEGYQSYQATIDSSNLEFMVDIAGQTVTTDGGAGFANADIHRSIRADLVKETATSIAYTCNTQTLPPFIAKRWGAGRLGTGTVVEWDVTPPKDLKAEAESMNQMGQAIKVLREALQAYGRDLDITQLCNRFGIPIAGDADGDGAPDRNANELEQGGMLQ